MKLARSSISASYDCSRLRGLTGKAHVEFYLRLVKQFACRRKKKKKKRNAPRSLAVCLVDSSHFTLCNECEIRQPAVIKNSTGNNLHYAGLFFLFFAWFFLFLSLSLYSSSSWAYNYIHKTSRVKDDVAELNVYVQYTPSVREGYCLCLSLERLNKQEREREELSARPVEIWRCWSRVNGWSVDAVAL